MICSPHKNYTQLNKWVKHLLVHSSIDKNDPKLHICVCGGKVIINMILSTVDVTISLHSAVGFSPVHFKKDNYMFHIFIYKYII